MDGIKDNFIRCIQTLKSKTFKKIATNENGTAPEFYFEKLTPSDSVDISAYENAFKFVFSNSDLTNIGITGAYCAGKSSVIETYKKKHPKLHFLTISLAQFDKSSANMCNTNESNNGEPTIEGKIINQLIHQIETRKIPLTSFKVKRPINIIFTILLSFIVTLFTLSFLVLVFNKSIIGYLTALNNSGVRDAFIKILQSDISALYLTIAVIVMSFILIIFAISAFRTRHFLKKLNIKGSEVTVFEECNDSYFDKYLNDVVYLFENCGSDVVVFEDLDRFKNSLVFERLREINHLVNRRKNFGNKKTLRFLYLMNDEIFITKDRTKFFDFIIPIVPIIDSSNSYDQLLQLFSHNRSNDNLDQGFLQDISLYIDDMRVLKNIRNEYEIYAEKVITTEQNHNKMLAYIVYKNLFPQDFENLQFNQGYLAKVLQTREKITNKLIQAHDKSIREDEDSIAKIHREFLLTLEELDFLYQHKPEYCTSANRVKPEFQDEFQTRRSLITMRYQNKEEEISKRVVELRKTIDHIRNAPFYTLINDQNSKLVFLEEDETIEKEIKANAYFPLIKYLVVNGMIDENYHDYQTVFYGRSISHNDKIFLRSITDSNPKEWAYKIDNVPLVAERIKKEHFANAESLNFDLLTFLIEHSDDFHVQLDKIIDQLKTTRNESFILDYFSLMGIAEKAIPSLALRWTELPSLIINSSKLSDVNKQFYINMFLISSSKETLEQMNLDNVLTYYIDNNQSFFDMSEVNTDKLVPALKIINVKMNNVNYVTANKGLWNIMYQNQLFDLNIRMIESILDIRYFLPGEGANIHKYLTVIFSKPDEPLSKLVNLNLNTTLNAILDACNSTIEDDESIVYYVFNSPEAEYETKRRYASFLVEPISSLDKISYMAIWQYLIVNGKAICNSANILTYFMQTDKKIDSNLIKFINDAPSSFRFDLSFKSMEKSYNQDNAQNFLNSVVKEEAINNDRYFEIIKAIRNPIPQFTYLGLSFLKICYLVILNVIPVNNDNLEFMRTNYQENLMYFISRNFDKYYDLVLKIGVPHNELLLILECKDLHHTKRQRLLKLANLPISVIGKPYPSTITNQILKNNLEPADLPLLVRYYSSYAPIIKETIFKITVQNIAKIVALESTIDYYLLVRLLNLGNIANSDKEAMLVQSTKSLDFLQFKTCLEALKMYNYLDLFNGKHPLFAKTPLNEVLLQKLKQRRWISSMIEEKENWYRVYSKQLH